MRTLPRLFQRRREFTLQKKRRKERILRTYVSKKICEIQLTTREIFERIEKLQVFEIYDSLFSHRRGLIVHSIEFPISSLTLRSYESCSSNNLKEKSQRIGSFRCFSRVKEKVKKFDKTRWRFTRISTFRNESYASLHIQRAIFAIYATVWKYISRLVDLH